MKLFGLAALFGTTCAAAGGGLAVCCMRKYPLRAQPC